MKRKAKKILFSSLVFVFSLILLTAIILFSYQKAYAGKIYNNVYFGNVDLSGLTTTQAEFLLKSKLKTDFDRQVKLTANGKSITVKLADTGLDFDYVKIADQSYRLGRTGSLFQKLKNSTITVFKKVSFLADPTIDQTKYNDFVNIATAQLDIPPQDATLAIQNGQVVFGDSHDGQTIKTVTLADTIAGLAGTQNNRLTLATAILPAKIVSTNLSQANQQANDLLSKTYVFASQSKKYAPTKAQVGGWIELATVNNQTVAQLNQTKIKSYLDTIAKNFATAAVVQKVDANSGAVISAGQDGISLNEDKAVSDLLNQISNANITVALATTTTPMKIVTVTPNEGLVLGRFDGKYIDVNIATQQLCRVEGQNLVDCNTVSTGKASTPTPTGTFSIIFKDPMEWSTASSLWMPWFEEYKAGGYGFHELPRWPNGYQEGADHLGIPVSHGCIRLGVGPAETLYNWTDIGTPVYIHK